jgi:dTDP-4-dehydrorhamnose 3,5-epimerase
VDGVTLTPLRKINSQKGSVLHAMKKSDSGFDGFGEAYFSAISKDSIKGWKKHTKMTLNIIVPIGIIKFVVFNEPKGKFFSVTLSQENYQRLTIKPGLTMAFKGIGESNILLNLANIEHDPEEGVNINLNEITYEW